jgi:glyoxylase-like metal-dependent hydrolase (beta-lactamase superfamily II)
VGITWINEWVGYHPGPVNIGVVRLSDDEALIVDAGLDDDRARKALRALEQERLRPTILLVTHANADHFGGAGIMRRRGLRAVAASPIEAGFIREPFLEPFCLNGWAAPPPQLTTKFLLAPPTDVEIEVSPGPWHPDGAQRADLEILALPGHSPGQCGLRAGDVIFCADAVFAPEIWNKHRFVYFGDVPAALASIGELERRQARVLVGGHCVELEDPARLLGANREALDDLSELVYSCLSAEGSDTEQVLATAARSAGVGFADAPAFYLARSTVQAHLSRLVHEGRASLHVERERLLWRTA